jgi:hypothetical protein
MSPAAAGTRREARGNDACMARFFHFIVIGVKDAVVVRLAVLKEFATLRTIFLP